MRKFNITVNNKSYEVLVEEIREGGALPGSLVTSLPTQAAPVASGKPAVAVSAPSEKPAAQAGGEPILAPMAGNIWKIVAKEGETVKAGQVLLILEAMKMENEIMAPTDGKVASIHVQEGNSVEGGALLMTLE